MKKYVNWRIFAILLGLSLVSVVCIFPYVLTIQGDVIKKVGKPIQYIFIAQFIQSIILFSIVIFLGLFFTKKTNFQLPLLEAILNKGDSKKILKNILVRSMAFGFVTALLIYLLDPLFTFFGTGISTHQTYAPVWQKLLAAFYGGITEEIVMRLFLMTFCIWISMKVSQRTEPTNTGIIISIIFAAIIFGLGHLPITSSVTKIDTLTIVRAIVLNGIGGIIFGWLFWKKGFESAVIAHFTADIFLLSLLPLLLKF